MHLCAPLGKWKTMGSGGFSETASLGVLGTPNLAMYGPGYQPLANLDIDMSADASNEAR